MELAYNNSMGHILDVEKLWEQHALFVYRLCCHFTRDQDLAKDLRQEVFMRIMAKGDEYKGTAEIRSWIYAIARNCCMDHFRRERRGRLDFVGYEKLDSLQEAGSLQLADSETVLWDAPDKLQACPPLGRALLELHFCEGLSHGEIATLLGISRPAVGKKIHQALSLIKKTTSP
jgi:RNA polymerase sigma-70 factor, ECF subfamily